MGRSKFTLEFAFIVITLNILLLLPSTSGYFEAHLISFNMVDKNDTSFMNYNELRVKKINRTYVLTGTYEFFEDVGNDHQLVSYFFKNTANQYIKMPYKIGPLDFCQYFDEDKYFVEDFRKVTNIPPIGTCPWPKGKYTINGYSTKLNQIPPLINSGDYMMETHTLKNGIVRNKIQFHVRLENF